MICKHCGTEIADKALICFRCGNATTDPVAEAPSPVRRPSVAGTDGNRPGAAGDRRAATWARRRSGRRRASSCGSSWGSRRWLSRGGRSRDAGAVDSRLNCRVSGQSAIISADALRTPRSQRRARPPPRPDRQTHVHDRPPRDSNDLRLGGQRRVARARRDRHRERQFVLRDRGSRYGTFVNGEAVTEHRADARRPHPARPHRRRRGGVPVRPTPRRHRAQATTTAVGDLRQIAALLEGLRALGSGRVLDEVLALVHRRRDRGHRRRARLHHARRIRTTAARVQAGARAAAA